MHRFRNKWRVQWVDQSGRRRSAVFRTKTEAETCEAELRLGLRSDGLEHQLANDETTEFTFEEFAEFWLEHYCRVEKAESQWADDTRVIRGHLVPHMGDIKISDLKRPHLESLKGRLVGATWGHDNKPYSAKTVNNYIALAKKIAKTAVDWELVPKDPFSAVKMLRVGQQAFDFWLPEERDRFLRFCAAVDPEFTRLVTMACHTGLRLGELRALNRGALDFRRSMITVSQNFCFKAKKTVDRTKNRTIADVPMNASVLRVVRHLELAAFDAPVFDPFAIDHASRRLRQVATRAGVRAIRFHDLRHTFASCLAMAGVDVMTIKSLMRHKTLQMTMRYAHLHPSYLEGATDVLCNSADDGNAKMSTHSAHKAKVKNVK